MENRIKWQPFIYGLLIASGIAIGIWLRPPSSQGVFSGKGNKINEILNIVKQAYVDTVNIGQIEETTINGMLTQLDPHSVYIAAADLQRANEQLEGEFEGIGVEFNIMNDTIMVITPLNGGPSKELGILSGDRIIEVEGKSVTGPKITNEQVFKLLRGKKGSSVSLLILRPDPGNAGAGKKISYTVIRNKIPLYSVDMKSMLDGQTGYIKVSRFAADTYEEFKQGLSELKAKGMKNLVLDLRGNPGGYLNAVTDMVDEVLDDNKLIVYTEGRAQARNDYHSEKKGLFEEGKLIVLIDEGSASASEIFAGAVQDQDRGIIIGRRSFGKGLVQEPFDLKDGSALRLTVARYYTPSGRCIQKPYENYSAYEREILDRYEKGELGDSSKFHVKDSTIYKTTKGRTVYGGGGIMPDIFIPIDTSFQGNYLTDVLSNNLLNQFAISYTDQHRKSLSVYKDASGFNQNFKIDLSGEFTMYAESKSVSGKKDEVNRARPYISQHVKALIGRQLFRDEGYFTVLNSSDKVLRRAIEAISEYEHLLTKK